MKIPPPPLFIRDAAGSAAPGPAVPGPEIRQKSGGFLNQTTLIIILLIFAVYVVFQGIKSFQLRSMNTALRAKDSETLEKIADMGMTRRLLGDYACVLYKLRGYYVAKETDKFEETLRHMIEAPYKNPADKKSFLENYFHTFLIKGNRKYADWLLEAIKKTDDEKLVHYSEMSYGVMMDQRSDLIDEMTEDVNSKKYYGFALGAILVMIAKQYLYLEDRKNALAYFQSAKACLEPRAVYMPLVEKNLRELETEEQER